uniref:Uncharacterized protein n=1 Tax=Ditylenchus dipsaci TaxID=166011 RepID=A0A915D5I2_9BILA
MNPPENRELRMQEPLLQKQEKQKKSRKITIASEEAARNARMAKKVGATEEIKQNMMARQKSAAVLPSQMSNIAGIRWSKKGAKKTAKARSVRAGNSIAVFSDRRSVRRALRKNLINKIEKDFLLLISQLEEIYKSLGADKQAFFFQTFTGNHIRKLLTGEGPKNISTVLPSAASRVVFASFLETEEINAFKILVAELFSCFKRDLASTSITPKCHLLCAHVSDFMENHTFWGLLSEQCIEALHAVVNRDERRLASMRERNNILRKTMECSFVRNVLFDLEIVCEDLEDILK